MTARARRGPRRVWSTTMSNAAAAVSTLPPKAATCSCPLPKTPARRVTPVPSPARDDRGRFTGLGATPGASPLVPGLTSLPIMVHRI